MVVISLKKPRIYRLYQELGYITGTWYIFDKFLRALTRNCFIRRYYIVSQPIKVDSGNLVGRGSKHFMRVLTSDSHDIIEQMPRDKALLQQRLSDGSFCFYSVTDDKFSGMLWFKKKVYHEDEVSCVYMLTPSDAVVWDYDVFIDKKYRIGTLFYKLWKEAMSRLLAENIRCTVSRISAFNANSLRSHQRMGASVLDVVTFVIIRNHQITIFGKWPYVLYTRLISDKKPSLSIDVGRSDVTLGMRNNTRSR